MSDVSIAAPAAPAPAAPAAPQASSEVADQSVIADSVESTDVDGLEGGDVEGQESLEEAIEAKKEEIKRSNKKKIPLKVNGKQQEVEIDLDNDQELAKYLQKAMAADERFQEASSMRKQMDQFIDLLRNDPLSILMHPDIGVDVKNLAERVINQEIEEMQKSPEQKEQERLQRELEELRQQLESEQNAKRQAELARLEEQAFMQLDQDIDEALASSKTLPKSPYVIKRIADAMINATELGYHNVRVQDILPVVEQEMVREMQEMFGKMPEEVLENLLGDNSNRLRKRRLAKAQKPVDTANQVKQTNEGTKKNMEASKPKVSPVEKQKEYKKFFSPF